MYIGKTETNLKWKEIVMEEKIKLRDYNIFYFITLLSILVLKSKEAGIITTFFVVGGILIIFNYIIFISLFKNLLVFYKRKHENILFLVSLALQLIGAGLFVISIAMNFELLIGPQMDTLTLPIILYLIGINLIEISGLVAYVTQEKSKDSFPWISVILTVLLIISFNVAVLY